MEKAKKGFTLLELLIVIAIIVLLGVILIFALNPAETLAKSRDAQRISDLSTMKTALGVYTTTVTMDDTAGTDIDLDGTQIVCLFQENAARTGLTGGNISYSLSTAALCDDATGNEPPVGADATGASFEFDAGASNWCNVATGGAAGNTLADGTGWIPVDFGLIAGGSPISSLPVDPTNTLLATGAPVFSDPVYRYACNNDATGTLPDYVFELNATLESTTYATDDDLDANDGGDEADLYEVGTSVRLMGNSSVTATEY